LQCAGNAELDLASLHSIVVIVDQLAENNHLARHSDEPSPERDNLVPLGEASTQALLQVLAAVIGNPKTKATIKPNQGKKKGKEKVTVDDEVLLTATRTLNTICGREEQFKQDVLDLDILSTLLKYACYLPTTHF
jgi:hypothetical protein